MTSLRGGGECPSGEMRQQLRAGCPRDGRDVRGELLRVDSAADETPGSRLSWNLPSEYMAHTAVCIRCRSWAPATRATARGQPLSSFSVGGYFFFLPRVFAVVFTFHRYSTAGTLADYIILATHAPLLCLFTYRARVVGQPGRDLS